MRFAFTIPMVAITSNQDKLLKKEGKLNESNSELNSNCHQKIKLYGGLRFAKLKVHAKRYSAQMKNSYYTSSCLLLLLSFSEILEV